MRKFKRLRSADVCVSIPSRQRRRCSFRGPERRRHRQPVVMDFGGPGDIVHQDVSYKVPMTNESEIVSRMEKILIDLAANRDLLNRLRQQGMSYARESLTWDAEAQSVTKVLHWAVRRGPKPDLPPPKVLHSLV